MKWLIFISFGLSLLSSSVFAAKKECASLLTKLHNVQAQQRSGQSLKNSNRLRKKEDLSRKNWWECENNKNKKKRSSTNKKYKVLKKKSANVYKKNKSAKHVFASNKLVIKGKYSGQEQSKWLAFYKRPKKCARPKTTQVFAYCMEHKEQQQKVFEKEYQIN